VVGGCWWRGWCYGMGCCDVESVQVFFVGR